MKGRSKKPHRAAGVLHAATLPMIAAPDGGPLGGFYVAFHNREDTFHAAIEAPGHELSAVMNEMNTSKATLIKESQRMLPVL